MVAPGVGDVVPFWWRVVDEGLVHRIPFLGGVVASEGKDGHRVPFVYEDGREHDVVDEATQVGWT